MDHEWLPLSSDELRAEATKLRMLASKVHRPDLACRLEEQAAELLAKAELRLVRSVRQIDRN